MCHGSEAGCLVSSYVNLRNECLPKLERYDTSKAKLGAEHQEISDVLIRKLQT